MHKGAFRLKSTAGRQIAGALIAMTFSLSSCSSVGSTSHQLVANGGEIAVSCIGNNFCMALVAGSFNPKDNEQTDYIFLYDRVSWKLSRNFVTFGQPIMGADPEISCNSVTFCLAYDNSTAVVLSGNSWEIYNLLDRQHIVSSISCGASTECVAVDLGGRANTFLKNKWLGWQTIIPRPYGVLFSISCWNANNCFAVGDGGIAVRYADGVWLLPELIDQSPHAVAGVGIRLMSISCPAISFCMAADVGANYMIYRDGSWTIAKAVSGLPLSPRDKFGLSKSIIRTWISCSITTSCFLAVNMQPQNQMASPELVLAKYQAGKWQSSNHVAAFGQMNSFSCNPEGKCTLGSQTGNIIELHM
jgi:hypothetical protein